jgi:hypothetical protein
MGVVVGVAVKVTAVAVGDGCGGGVAVGAVAGLHPERLNNMVKQAATVTFLTIDKLRLP